MNEKKYLTAQEAAQRSESFNNLPDVFSQIEKIADKGERIVRVENPLKEFEIETLKSLGYKVFSGRYGGRFTIEW